MLISRRWKVISPLMITSSNLVRFDTRKETNFQHLSSSWKIAAPSIRPSHVRSVFLLSFFQLLARPRQKTIIFNFFWLIDNYKINHYLVLFPRLMDRATKTIEKEDKQVMSWCFLIDKPKTKTFALYIEQFNVINYLLLHQPS